MDIKKYFKECPYCKGAFFYDEDDTLLMSDTDRFKKYVYCPYCKEKVKVVN